MTDRLEQRAIWALLAVLGGLVLIVLPGIGSDPWLFRPGSVNPHGLLAPLVRAAHERWDLGVMRTAAMLAGVVVAAAACVTWRAASWRPAWAVALCTGVVALLLVPPVLLQVGLREATAPWFHTNDSTYQIELAGDLVRHGKNPYGHSYEGSGLERFYSRDGTIPPPSEHRQVALSHFAYFPGTALTAAAWGVLPSPLDDYRLLVMLATLATFFAVLLFQGPLVWKLGVGVLVAANPLAVRAAWFGTADAPSLLCLVLAFALVTRRRFVWAALALAAAILLKQFALVAVPFFALMLLASSASQQALRRAAAVFALVLVAGFLPFLVADPRALWQDTIAYGADTYRIVGYGLSSLLLRTHVLDDRWGSYPFAWLALLVWLPVTLWLLWNTHRSGRLWAGAAGFAVSVFVLLFVGRVFQTSYLIWPLVGIALASLLWVTDPAKTPP